MNTLDNTAVLHLDHFNAEQTAVAAIADLSLIHAALIAGNLDRTQTGDVHQRADGMGAVEVGIHMVTPMTAVAVGDLMPDGLTVMDVFTLAVLKLTDLTLAVQLAHLIGGGHIAIVLTVCINQTALLHSLDQLDCLLHCLYGQDLAEHVLAGLQTFDGKWRVLVGIVRQHYGIHVVLDKLLKIGIIRNIFVVQFFFLAFKSLDPLIADRDQFRIVRNITIFHHTAAAIHADNAYSDLLHCLSSCVPAEGVFR